MYLPVSLERDRPAGICRLELVVEEGNGPRLVQILTYYRKSSRLNVLNEGCEVGRCYIAAFVMISL